LEGEAENINLYLLRPCKGVVGFVAKLKKNTSLDLIKRLQKLENSGFKIVDADVMLIAE
jgi:hypothetical protein